jgi:uncharacterized cofD-like protein
MKTVVIIGGGTSRFTFLKGLREFPVNNIVIVSTADDGGSTGILRRELEVMPQGDIRQCLVALSYTAPALRNLFNYRFDRGSLKGHSMGNIILATLEKVTGSPEGAIAEAARLLNVRGEVLFASKKPTVLSAILENGTKITSEHKIDEPTLKKHSPIKKLSLSASEANPRALNALSRADAIIFGPGDLYTSTLPILLVPGIREAIAASSAKKILITNIMTKFGQTNGFTASKFLTVVNDYLRENGGGRIDTVVVNTKKPAPALLARYRKEKASFVLPDIEKLKKESVAVIAKPVISNHIHKKAAGDTLQRSFIRHDPEKTAEIIWNAIN